MSEQFSINFVSGEDYNATQQREHIQVIKNSFCLLSWLIPHFKIRIKKQMFIKRNQNVKIFTKQQTDVQYYIYERRNNDKFYYSVGIVDAQYEHRQRGDDDWDITSQFLNTGDINSWSIKVTWKKTQMKKVFFNNAQNFRKQLFDRFNYFKPPCKNAARQKTTLKDIQYYYIQPENKRYFEPDGYHINLAFQGGGAKGVSYVGVNQAIKKLQARIKQESRQAIELPIKSVIGSSAGGILSLAISAGIQNNDLIELCYMMDTLVQDLIIPTQQSARIIQRDPSMFNHQYSSQIQRNFFAGQEKAIKNVLHNLGLVQDSLSDIIFETLKQPSVQDKIIALFTAINPSIASLLTFKNNPKSQGESIKNFFGSVCCCCYSNCCWDCCGMYPCCRSVPGTNCFIEVSNNYRKVNIYGLLYAALMTGSAVENILAYALALFFEIQARKRSIKLIQICDQRGWFDQQITNEGKFNRIISLADSLRELYQARLNGRDKEDKRYLDNYLMKISKELTLSQYYELNGVEFTCTSVDLNDKILRFFNHKTTPDLPVCKAVQMTGSFPAAFLSLKWKKQWGKYYVHYDQTRREIDLEGHNFTDGGLLANFPLKFLDNEKFREKYFSHKKVEQRTILYGFGLDQLSDFPENDKSQQVNACKQSLLAEFKYRLMYKLVIYFMKCSTKDTLEIKNVKLLDFLVSLVDAMRQSDRNLNIECFREEIIVTQMDKLPIQSQEELKRVSPSMTTFLQNFRTKIQFHFNKQHSQFISDEIYAIYDRFQANYEINRPRLSWKQVQQIQWTIQDNLLLYSQRCVQIYQNKIRQLKEKYGMKDFFFTSMTNHHEPQILNLLNGFKRELMAISQQQFVQIKRAMQQNYQKFFNQLKDIHNNLGKSKGYAKQKQALQLLQLKYKVSPFVIKVFNQLEKSFLDIYKTSMINYCVEQYTYLNRARIRNQIRHQIYQKTKQIQQRNNEVIDIDNPIQIHIILQAKCFSYLYFPNYIKIVEEVVAAKNMKIDIISCSDYHAIFGVLYVMGYETSKIKTKLADVEQFFEENSMIDKTYDSKEWMKTTVEQIKTLLKRQWEKKQNPFDYVQQKMKKTTQNNIQMKQFHEKFIEIEDKFEDLKEEIDSSIEKILDYIAGSFKDIEQLSEDKREDRFQQLLSLGKYKKLNAKRSKKGQKILTHFLKHTINLLMLSAQFIFKSQQYTLFSSDKMSKQTLFKGMILSSLLNASIYKMKIFDILEMEGLDNDITLQQFYDVCPRKIVLNFNVINTSQQRFALINKYTKPNMPLWAALMASASLPYLSGEFGSRMEWEKKQKGDISMQKADIIFRNFEINGGTSGNSYISGNFISSLPVELMTNQRLVVSKLSDKKNPQIIEIVFAFQPTFKRKNEENMEASRPQNAAQPSNYNRIQSLLTQLPKLMQGKRRFPNCLDALGYICEYVCWCCKLDVGWYFSDMLKKISTFKMLGIRINSHDNLIQNLYYDRLIKLPLRIGTLDFYKISRDLPDLNDTILQAEQVVRQLCDTIQYNNETARLEYTPSELSTIQVSFHYHNMPHQPWNRTYRLKFISYTKWRDFNYKYVINYSLSANQPRERQKWKLVKDDYIDIHYDKFIESQRYILLSFTYYKQRLISHQYLLDLKDILLLSRPQDRVIFKINYRKLKYQEQNILINRLICRIIIKPYNLPRGSNLCTDQNCNAFSLKDILIEEKEDICSSCIDFQQAEGNNQHVQNVNRLARKPKLIGMQCTTCRKKYCLRCKISNFIVYKSQNNSLTYKCPKGNKKYIFKQVPIILNGIQVPKSNCLLCGKYAYRLRSEQGIQEARFPQDRNDFCGLRICETCSLYINS